MNQPEYAPLTYARFHFENAEKELAFLREVLGSSIRSYIWADMTKRIQEYPRPKFQAWRFTSQYPTAYYQVAKSVLEDIAANENLVKRHRGWYVKVEEAREEPAT
jgi:hypothetical protein